MLLKIRDLTFRGDVHLLLAFLGAGESVRVGQGEWMVALAGGREQTTNQNRVISVRFPHNYYVFQRPKPERR